MSSHDHDLMPYPTSPGDSITLVVRKLGGQDVERNCLVHAGTHLVCYALGQAFPDGRDLVGATSHSYDRMPHDELKSCLERLERGEVDTADRDDDAEESHSIQGVSGTEGPSTAGFPWLQVVLTLMPLVQEWIRNR